VTADWTQERHNLDHLLTSSQSRDWVSESRNLGIGKWSGTPGIAIPNYGFCRLMTRTENREMR